MEIPISTIKKGVRQLAENMASKESREIPEFNDYKKAFAVFKALRELSPDKYKKLVILTSMNIEVKEELGNLYKIFNSVLDEIMAGYLQKQQEKSILELVQFKNGIFDLVSSTLKADPRIIVAFKGQEHRLIRAINKTRIQFKELEDLYAL